MLTDSYIKSLKLSDKKRHTDLYGLVLELRPNKKKLNKVFIFRFQWNKKPQTITIGEYRSIGIAEARGLALTYRNMVNKDIDPRSKDSDVEQAKITFGVVADQWFQKYKGTWKEFARNRHLKSLSRDILSIIDKPIDEITKADLLLTIKPHEDLGHHDVAHRLYSRLESIFEFALGASLTENYPFLNSPRCGAKTRKGTACQAPAMLGKKRCRIAWGRQGEWCTYRLTKCIKTRFSNE